MGGREEHELENMLEVLQGAFVSGSGDRLWWRLDEHIVFSVKCTRDYIDEAMLLANLHPTRWCKSLSRRFNIFMWRFLPDRLPTRFNLSKKGMDLTNI